MMSGYNYSPERLDVRLRALDCRREMEAHPISIHITRGRAVWMIDHDAPA